MTLQPLAAGGAVAGIAAGILEGDAGIVVAVLVAIVLVRAAQGLGDASYIICRAKPLEWLGIPDPQRPVNPDEEKRDAKS
jgi:hypothetical protein